MRIGLLGSRVLHPRESTLGRVIAVLGGHVLPLIASLVAFPTMFHALGAGRFGFFMLVWTIAGYAGILDLGLSRALTRHVAQNKEGEPEGLGRLFWTGQVVLIAFGAALASVLALLSGAIAQLAGADSGMRAEAVASFRALALCVPFLGAASAARGVLEGYERFDLVTAARIPTGVLSAVTPLAVVVLGGDLTAAVASLAAVRILTYAVFLTLCLKIQPGLRAVGLRWSSGLKGLLAYGGWVGVSNVVGPIIVNVDRFLLGALAGIAAVSYYATAFEAQNRLLILVTALTTVLFPAMASDTQGGGASASLLRLGNRATLGVLFPVCLTLVAFGPELLAAWMGREFASEASGVWRWLVVGVFVNGIAQTPFAYLQAIGRARSTALLHLAEILPYLTILSILALAFGAEGAAAAWTFRAGADCLVLMVMSSRSARVGLPPETICAGLATALLALFLLDLSLTARVVLFLAFLIGFLPLAWKWVLSNAQRIAIRRVLNGI